MSAARSRFPPRPTLWRAGVDNSGRPAIGRRCERIACLGPNGRSATGSPADRGHSLTRPTPHAAFAARVRGQTVLDADLGGAGLDPDGNGLAGDGLPLGTAPALWATASRRRAEPVALGETVDGDTIEVGGDAGRPSPAVPPT